MAYQDVFFTVPPVLTSTAVAASATAVALTAGTHYFAWGGNVWTPDKETKTIDFVEFLPGTITPNSSTMRLSLQNPDLANVFRPDGTADQSVTFADTAVTSSTWFSTEASGTLGRSVAYGEKIFVVLDYGAAGAGFGAGTSFAVSPGQTNTTSPGSCGTVSDTGSIAVGNALPNIILGFSDGTFGTVGPPGRAHPYSGLTTVSTFNTGSTPDEVALRFTVPYACKVSGGFFVAATNGGGRNFDIILYEGTTPLASEVFDSETQTSTTGRYHEANFGEEVELTPNTEYFFALKPTTASNVSHYYFTVADTNHFQAHAGGVEFYYADRSDAGAWNPIDTRRPSAGIFITAIDDGQDVGASGPAHIVGG
jgi:hypothetical protein